MNKIRRFLCKLLGCDSALTEAEGKEILKGLRALVTKLKGTGQTKKGGD